jgi:hypothetical protein
MIKSVNNHPVSTLLDVEAKLVYCIPNYQREYTWGVGSGINWKLESCTDGFS